MEVKSNILKQLSDLDRDLNRGTEDLLNTLLTKELITTDDIPQKTLERKGIKEALRIQLSEV